MNIKILRQRKGITQRELAEQVGMNRSYLVSIENGKRKPSLALLVRIKNRLEEMDAS